MQKNRKVLYLPNSKKNITTSFCSNIFVDISAFLFLSKNNGFSKVTKKCCAINEVLPALHEILGGKYYTRLFEIYSKYSLYFSAVNY